MNPSLRSHRLVRRHWWLIAPVTCLAAGLRLATAPNFDFYGDEFWTLQWSQASIGEIFGHFGRGLTMHLYILFIKGWASVTGLSPFMMKLPSLIAGIAMIPLVFWLGRKWLGVHSAALAAVLLALNAQMIIQSRTARVYTILAVAVLLSMMVFVRALRDRSNKDLALGSLINAGLLMLSVHSTYVLLVQGLVLVSETLSRRLPWRRLLPFATSFAVALGAAALFYARAFEGLEKVTNLSGVTQPNKITYSLWLPTQTLWDPFRYTHLMAPGLMLALLAIGSWMAWRKSPLTGRLLVLWACLPPLVYFLQRSTLPSDGIVRYLLPVLPAQLLLIGLGVDSLLKWRLSGPKRSWVLASATLTLTVVTVTNDRYHRHVFYQLEPTERAVQRILATLEPGDVITSFPEFYHEFFVLHFGESAIDLPRAIHRRGLPRDGRLRILTQIQPWAVPWWQKSFEVEEISGERYHRRFHLLTSKVLPAGPEALRKPLEEFYFGLLSVAANGKRLHVNPRVHYRFVSRAHKRMAHLAKSDRREAEAEEHQALEKTPRAWNGDLSNYPILATKLRDGR